MFAPWPHSYDSAQARQSQPKTHLKNLSTHLIHPKAPPRRIVSGCSVYTTILVNKGSSSGEMFSGVIGLGKAGKGRRSNGRVEGSYVDPYQGSAG